MQITPSNIAAVIAVALVVYIRNPLTDYRTHTTGCSSIVLHGACGFNNILGKPYMSAIHQHSSLEVSYTDRSGLDGNFMLHSHNDSYTFTVGHARSERVYFKEDVELLIQNENKVYVHVTFVLSDAPYCGWEPLPKIIMHLMFMPLLLCATLILGYTTCRHIISELEAEAHRSRKLRHGQRKTWVSLLQTLSILRINACKQ
jgi:hypothetical protein